MDKIRINSGESFSREVKIWSDAAHTAPEDLTDGEVTFTIYDSSKSTEPVLTGGVTVVDAEEGTVRISLSDEQTGFGTAVLYGEVKYTSEDGSAWIVDEVKLVVI